MIVWNRSNAVADRQSESTILEEGSRLRIGSDDYRHAWYSSDNQIAAFFWGSDVPPFDSSDRVNISPDMAAGFTGWIMENGALLSSVGPDSIRAEGTYVGEFAAFRALNGGEFRVWRNITASVPLYYSNEHDRFIVSTRASLVAFGRRRSSRFELDPEFFRSVATASISLNDHSAFSGVRSMPQDAHIYRPPGGRPAVYVRSEHPLYDEGLQRKYREQPERYWDDVFDEVRSLMGVYDAGGLPIVLPLSGGKDSRLLLGLIASSGKLDRLSEVVTWGLASSPDMAVAKVLSQEMGLSDRHTLQITDPTNVALPKRNDRFLQHAFVTEGEVSPMDLSGRRRVSKTLQVHGQEAGLRNIAGTRPVGTVEEALHWFRVHLGRFDICNILTDDAVEKNEQEFLDYFSKRVDTIDSVDQLPTKHRGEFRIRRWMARIWMILNSTSYAPFLLAVDPIIRATYNAGARSRSLEQFHFEMLNRANPRLAQIPFAEQTWPEGLAAVSTYEVPRSKPLVWNEEVPSITRRPMAQALQGCLPELKRTLMARRPAVLEGVLDYRKLAQFDPAELKSGHVQPLMHLVNVLAMDAADEFAQLDIHAETIRGFTVPDFDGTAAA